MIVRRVYHGIASHFPTRRLEWVMLIPLFGMWLAFQVSPDMFTISRSYDGIARYAREETWAAVVFVCGLTRLFALVVNGTFKSFRLSPHFRAVSAVVSLFFWGQVMLGFASSFMGDGGSPLPLVYLTTFCAIELLNFTTSAKDIGTDVRQASDKADDTRPGDA